MGEDSTLSSREWNHLIQTYAIATLVLAMKYLFSQFYGANLANHPEEDRLLIGQADMSPKDLRKERQALNDIENIPFHFGIFLLAFIVQNFANASGESSHGNNALIALYVTYVTARVLYTICYINALQVKALDESDLYCLTF
jgi:uncharacterized MAPEG superfamily protein